MTAAGVTPEQITGLNVEDPDQQAVVLSAQTAAIGEEIKLLAHFNTSVDIGDLAGPGLKTLIKVAYSDRLAAEVSV